MELLFFDCDEYLDDVDLYFVIMDVIKSTFRGLI